jgi:tetratricopeptide (TPR) repeat protein
MGKALASLDRADEAEAAFRRALVIEPDKADVLTDLGSALVALNRTDEAIATYRRVLDGDSTHANALINLGGVLRDAGRLDEAIELLRRAVEILPGQAMAHFNLGLALRDGDQAAALVALGDAVALDPDLAEARFVHALLHEFEPDAATLAALEDALATTPLTDSSRVFLLFALGKGYDDLGRYDAAFSFYRQANPATAAEAEAAGTTFDTNVFQSRLGWIKGYFARRIDPRPLAPAGPVPVFVVGPARSGKTLIEPLLATHPGVHAAGEGDQWAGALRTVADRHDLPDSLLLLMEAANADHAAEIGAAYRDAMIADVPDAGWVINTAPGYFETVSMILWALPAARVIHCQRDPLDTGL